MLSTAVWNLRAQARFRAAVSLAVLGSAVVLGVLGLAFVASFVWPQEAVATPKEHVAAGNVNDFEIGRPQQFFEGRFWLVRLSQTEVIALYQQDPKLGCTVPWREHFRFTDPRTGQSREGWFRNPCHGQTYDLDGHCVSGPCIRGLDRRPVTLSNDGSVVVNVADHRLTKGQSLRP